MTSQQNKEKSNPDIAAVLGLGESASKSVWQRWRGKIIVGVLVLAAIGAYVILGKGGSYNAVQYITQPASRGDLTVMVTATGSVQPTNQVDISSELSGTIRKVLVDYNDKVKIGQVLAELDTDKLKALVASSRAKLAAANAKVKSAEATRAEMKTEHERKRQLELKKISSTHDLDTAKAAYERAIATVDSAKADVAAAVADLNLNETNLAKTCICSPIKGIVLKRDVEPGQTVASALQAPVLFTIAEDLTKMEIQVDVDEADVGKVSKGQRASFTVDAYPNRQFGATIKELRFGSEVVQGVVTYKAVLTTDNAELLLRPGMTATAEIVVFEVKDALSVPNAALRFSPQVANKATDNRSFLKKLLPGRPRFRRPSTQRKNGSKRTVWTLDEDKVKKITVETGSTDGKRTQVLKGELKAGQAVIVDTATSKK